MNTPTAKQMLSLGMLRMPLALLELPLFVLLPKLYNEIYGLALTTVGAVLLVTRLVDALIDPLIGAWLDRPTALGRFNYRFWICAGLPILIAGFAALLWPASGLTSSGSTMALWLGGFSVITYLSYSLVSISYQAWGAQWGDTETKRARFTSLREACGLAGVLLAAVWLTPKDRPMLFLTMIALALIAIVAMLTLPIPRRVTTATAKPFSAVSKVISDQSFLWLIGIFALNGIASAIPATLVLFFVQDVVGAPNQAPMFLASYFLAGAVGMPLWAWLARIAGLKNTWLLGMLFSVFAFAGAMTLERGSVHLYHGICIVTGLALGADLAMPPALLASLIAARRQQTSNEEQGEAAYFGVWNLVTKLNLAIAAGLGLPLLQALGYVPGGANATQNTLALSLVYAALPCLLKLMAGAALLLNPHLSSSKDEALL
jgi:glycoside/pentoside/hexuronide:cation symporter, GPH family